MFLKKISPNFQIIWLIWEEEKRLIKRFYKAMICCSKAAKGNWNKPETKSWGSWFIFNKGKAVLISSTLWSYKIELCFCLISKTNEIGLKMHIAILLDHGLMWNWAFTMFQKAIMMFQRRQLSSLLVRKAPGRVVLLIGLLK